MDIIIATTTVIVALPLLFFLGPKLPLFRPQHNHHSIYKEGYVDLWSDIDDIPLKHWDQKSDSGMSDSQLSFGSVDSLQ
jgi:hypothetical protein